MFSNGLSGEQQSFTDIVRFQVRIKSDDLRIGEPFGNQSNDRRYRNAKAT